MTMPGMSLGPNHPRYGIEEPMGPVSRAVPGARRTGRQPRPLPEAAREKAGLPPMVVAAGPVADPETGRERLSLTQPLFAYARQHRRAAPLGRCLCELCGDLRWHVGQQEQSAPSANGGR